MEDSPQLDIGRDALRQHVVPHLQSAGRNREKLKGIDFGNTSPLLIPSDLEPLLLTRFQLIVRLARACVQVT